MTAPNLTLPPAVAAELRHIAAEPGASLLLSDYMAALRAAGWSYRAIGDPLGVTREAVRQRIDRAPRVALPTVPTPPPTRPVDLRKRGTAGRPRINRHRAATMRALAAQSRHVNGATPADAPERAASDALVEHMVAVLAEGFTVYQIAQVLDVTLLAVKVRLGARGIGSLPPSMQHLTYKGRPGLRVQGQQDETCGRGHDMSPGSSNVRHVNGDPKVRACRRCQTLRTQEYRERKAQQRVAS